MRAIVERAIGPSKCCDVIVVTAMLHNMALKANVHLADGEDMEEAEDEEHAVHPPGMNPDWYAAR